eukprot:4817878-Alexandrium_andersonii.AAC.1
MQSSRAHRDRPKSKLYASMPRGGIPLEDGGWVDPRCLLQLNTAAYGLAKAPATWRRTLVRAVEELGYR